METEGFSGADLQAVVYNAHLEVVHASIAHAVHAPESGKGKERGKGKGKAGVVESYQPKARRNHRRVVPVEEDSSPASIAEQAVMTNRVSSPTTKFAT